MRIKILSIVWARICFVCSSATFENASEIERLQLTEAVTKLIAISVADSILTWRTIYGTEFQTAVYLDTQNTPLF